MFDQDFFRQALADAKPGVANLAQQAGLTAEQLDLLFFAKAHFAEPMGHFRGSGELFDAHIDARAHAAKRTQEWLGTLLPINVGTM